MSTRIVTLSDGSKSLIGTTYYVDWLGDNGLLHRGSQLIASWSCGHQKCPTRPWDYIPPLTEVTIITPHAKTQGHYVKDGVFESTEGGGVI